MITDCMTSTAVICPVAEQARLRGASPAIMAGDLSWSYQELNDKVQAQAKGLHDSGLREGDVLMACGRNSPRLVVLILACLRAGIIVLPVNPSFPDSRLAAIADDVGVTGLWSEHDDRLLEWCGVHIPAQFPTPAVCDHGINDTFSWNEQRICNLVLTSGSSGVAKAAAHNFAGHRASAYGSNRSIPLRPNHRWLLSLPLFHIGGLATLFRCLLAGAAMVFPDNSKDMLATLRRRRVTHLSLVNTQLYRLLQHNDFDGFAFAQTSVQVILMGGGYVSADLVEQCQQQGILVMTTYGMTEMSSQISTGVPHFSGQGLLSSGTPIPNSELRIDDDEHIHVRGAMLFCGYWRRGALIRSLDDDGWFATGDRGHWLEVGSTAQLQIAGRVDFQFISGGENIQPEQIEKVIMALPGVEQSVVVPVADQEFGYRPVAFIDYSGEFTPKLWQHSLRKALPGYMVPDRFFHWPEQAVASLKVNRRELTALAAKLVSVC